MNLISINDEEARILTGEFSLTKAAKKIHQMGPRYVIIKKGEHGAQLYGDGKVFITPAYPIDQVVDPTGAGDSFAGGLAGFLAQAEEINFDTIKQALVVGSVFASFTVESFGVKAIEEVKADALNERIHRFRKLTSFDWTDNTLSL